MRELATKLQGILLDTANNYNYIDNTDKVKHMLLDPTLAIFKLLEPTECSLWSINQNVTDDDGKTKASTSLICRGVNGYKFNDTVDYCHDLEKGVFYEIIVNKKPQPFYRCGQKEVKESNHRSWKFVQHCELNDFIVIPIKTKIDNEEVMVAVLEFSYKEQIIKDDDWNEISPIICTFFSAAFKRYLITQKRILVDKLIEVHDKFRDTKLEKYFNHLLTNVFRDFFNYQGASFFIWDSYYNKYSLIATTDETINVNTTEVFYIKGEGHTGRVGATGQPCVIDSIRGNRKWYEVPKEEVLTAMMIPIIASTSNPQNVIGIIRFVNKKNVVDSTVIDYFNNVDLELMMHASKYLSLAVSLFLKEEEQSNLISKLAHEFKTPANAIFKTADRLLDHIEDMDFIRAHLTPYLTNIKDFASSQQANSFLYLTSKRNHKYNIKKCSLYEVLQKSREVARPIAKDFNVKIDNIVIIPFDGNLFLNIDKEAFVIVFQNLLSNAIKYHNYRNPNSFYVSISCEVTKDTIRLLVEDYGIGIDEAEKESIFHVGFRGASAIKKYSYGFGVGLSVVKQIVEDFGGTVGVLNSKDPTIFEISLPNSLIV